VSNGYAGTIRVHSGRVYLSHLIYYKSTCYDVSPFCSRSTGAAIRYLNERFGGTNLYQKHLRNTKMYRCDLYVPISPYPMTMKTIIPAGIRFFTIPGTPEKFIRVPLLLVVIVEGSAVSAGDLRCDSKLYHSSQIGQFRGKLSEVVTFPGLITAQVSDQRYTQNMASLDCET